jgi:hypothetical protein
MILAVAAFFAAGCATAYQPHGLTGGYTGRQIDDNTVYVTFRGNGFTPEETVHTYLLRRCAEITLQHGFNYFVIVRPNVSDEGNTNIYGAKINNKYMETVTVKMFKGAKPTDSLDAYNAAQIVENPSTGQGL